jgi:UDP-2,3-diacylglucosamine pyrophosphatase LpxH
VVREILRRAARGTEVVFIPGNHDESLREFVGLVAAGVSITDRAIHTMADGRRLLVLHGDEFDGAVRYARWLYFLGDWSYRLAIVVNRWFNVGRRLLGLPYWSLSAYLKRRVKNAVQFVANFETAVAAEAARQGTDGVVCGHIHHAELRTLKGVIYANDGDWVESCTALVEHLDGRLEIVHGAVPVSAPIPQYALAS